MTCPICYYYYYYYCCYKISRHDLHNYKMSLFSVQLGAEGAGDAHSVKALDCHRKPLE
jgi:hypothetical protein